jgi:hypothetical protein
MGVGAFGRRTDRAKLGIRRRGGAKHMVSSRKLASQLSESDPDRDLRFLQLAAWLVSRYGPNDER